MYKELNKLRAVHGSYDDLLSGTGAMATTDFSQADMGDNPAVNLATGRLRYSFDDLSVGYGNFAVNVGHVYLSQHFSAFASKFPELSSGWKLNVAQYIVFNSSSSSLTPYALYMDEAGEVHRFVKFDDTRYYDERNAKITLNVGGDSTFDNVFIEDGAGNRIYFNRQGRVSKTVSCHNNTMMKLYEYDEKNRLVKVYDYRMRRQVTHTSYNIGAYIEFGYDEVDRLSSATAYAGKVLSSVNYGYDSNGRLTQVDRVAYNRKNRQCLVTPSLGFEYTNRLLTQATDLETKSAYRFTYADGKISKVEQGVIAQTAAETGATDADGNSLAYCGNGLYCGAPAKTEFVRKASNSYDYYYDGGDTRIASETDVTNQNNIKLAYFINRDACVTSAFEKVDSNLKTLDKQGAKRISGLVGSDIGATEINGIKRYSASGTLSVLENAAKEVTRNDREQGLRTFNYSFWLKLPQKGEFMQAKATYKFTSGAEQTSTVFIDGKAVNAWQAVSLPLYAPLRNDDDTKTDTLSYLTVQLLNNNQPYTGAYEFSEIGIAPAPISRMLLCCADGYTLPLTDVTSVTLGANVYNVSEDMYFTESDVVATYTNRYKNGGANFTVIYNNGTARKIASSIQFSSDYAATIDNAAPFVIQLNMTDGKTQITAKYTYNAQSMVITTEGKHENTSSSASVEIDYLGKTLKETDEYGVSKQYYYNDYGDVTRMQVVGSDGVVGSTVAYSYDGKGRLTGSHDGLTGQKVAYTEYDQVGTVTECKVSDDSLQETPHKAENTYGVFRDNALAVTEYDGDEQRASNAVTYEQGRIRTVTDGTRKYGVKYDLANGVVDYTRFELQNKERLVQRDSVLEVSSSDICQKHHSEFFEGDAVKDTLTTEVTKYGKVNAVSYQSGTNAERRSLYTYDDPSESGFAAVPTKLVDRESGTTTEYSYDADGNLTEWEEKDSASGQLVLKASNVSESVNRYTFSSNETYTTVTVSDSSKTLAPRISKVTHYSSPNADPYDHEIKAFAHEYRYDNLGRVKEKVNYGDSGGSHYTTRYNYKYKSLNVGADSAKYALAEVDFNNYPDGQTQSVNEGLNIRVKDIVNYDDAGNITQIDQTRTWIIPVSSVQYEYPDLSCVVKYGYDNLHRLVTEENSLLGIDRKYRYDETGRLSAVVSGRTVRQCLYDEYGRVFKCRDIGYSYDTYGNRKSRRKDDVTTYYSYAKSGLLTQAGNSKYCYNANGIRCKKSVNGVDTKYYLDGAKILGEDRCGDSTNRLRYFYEADGLTGFTYIAGIYRYVYDSQGNITMITNYRGNEVLAVYVYDAWGKCKVYDQYGRENNDSNFIGNVNPFRWKGYYYDAETGLYYVNGSYYDPDTGTYMNASPVVEALNGAYLTRSIDRNGLMCNNVLEFSAAQQESSNAFSSLSTITAKMLPALPWYFQHIAKGIDFAATVVPVIENAIWGLTKNGKAFLDSFYVSDGIDSVTALSNLRSPLGKISKGIGFALIALDLGVNVYNSIQQGYSWAQGITSFVLTAAKDIGVYFLSAAMAVAIGKKIGAAIGGTLGGPIGIIVGSVLGMLLGAAVDWLATNFINWIVDLIK